MNDVQLDTTNHYWEQVGSYTPGFIVVGSLLGISLLLLTPFFLSQKKAPFGLQMAFLASGAATLIFVIFASVQSSFDSGDKNNEKNMSHIQEALNSTYKVNLNESDVKLLANTPQVTSSYDSWSEVSLYVPGEAYSLEQLIENYAPNLPNVVQLGESDISVEDEVKRVQLWIVDNKYVLMESDEGKSVNDLVEITRKGE
jgi:hypothetical protein